jgi:hypothetical protein
VTDSWNKLLSETEEYLRNNDALLQAEFPNVEEFLTNKKNETKRYLKSKSKLFREKISESNLIENFLTDQEKELAKFLLKRNESLFEEARRTSTQSRNNFEMKDRERFILGLWLVEDIAYIKERWGFYLFYWPNVL